MSVQLERENERLKIYIENYKKQLNDLDEKYINEVQKLKDEHNKKIIELEAEIEMLKGKINLQSRKREIKDEEVEKIKELRDSGLSYRAIAKETGWSNVTISRALNGIYD